MAEYLFFCILLISAVGFVAVMIGINAWLGVKKNPNPVKQEPFECGSPPIQQPCDRLFQIRYSTVAILFVMFDLETVLLYPWAISARQMGINAILGGAIFLLLLSFALVYVWRKGLLNWH